MIKPVVPNPDTSDEKVWGHRVCPPKETLRRLAPYFSQMGITRLADVTGLDRVGIPVAQAIRPMGRSLSVSQGKGPDPDAAMASAAMEAAEGWHAEYLELNTCQSTARQLLPEHVYSGFPFHGDFPADQVLTFTEAIDLLSDGRTWVPSDYVHKDYTRPAEAPGAVRSTNGLASGNTLDEALCSALHEVIERDALADFEALDQSQRKRRRLSLTDAKALDPVADRLLSRCYDNGFRVFLYDLTNDLNVPAVRADLGEFNKGAAAGGAPVGRLSTGFGCHLDPATAAIRAVTEAAQSRLTQIAGSRDDLKESAYLPAEQGVMVHLLEQAMDLVGDGYTAEFSADQSTATPAGDVERLLRNLADAGLHSVLCCDLSRAGFPIHVVRLIVPGLGFLSDHRPVRGPRHATGGPDV